MVADAATTEHKAKLQAIKRSNATSQTEIAAVAATVAAELTAVRLQEAELEAEVAAVQALEAEHQQLVDLIRGQQVRMRGSAETEFHRDAAAITVATAETATKAALASATLLEHSEAALASSEGALSTAQAAVEAAEAQVAAQEATLAATGVTMTGLMEANEARGAEFREQSEWYKEATSVLVGLGGTRLRTVAADELEFELRVDGQTHSLVVPFEGTLAQSTIKPGAMLNGSVSRIEEACAEAVQMNSISLLVFRARVLLGTTARGA